MLSIMTLVMLTGMGYAIIINEGELFDVEFPHSFHLWLIKLPCAVALHLFLYPEVARGMNLMKFTNN